MELVSNIGMICAVAGLALLALFGDPAAGDAEGGTTAPVAPSRTLDQIAAVGGVVLLVAAGFFQAGQLW
jgi:hypothetical protein